MTLFDPKLNSQLIEFTSYFNNPPSAQFLHLYEIIMKRWMMVMSVTFAVGLLLITSIRQSVAEQRAMADAYLAQGFYDEAMVAYQNATLHLRIFRQAVQWFGEFNAFLATVGALLILSGLLMKRPLSKNRIKEVHF